MLNRPCKWSLFCTPQARRATGYASRGLPRSRPAGPACETWHMQHKLMPQPNKNTYKSWRQNPRIHGSKIVLQLNGCKWRLHNLAANQREPRVALLLALTKALTSISLPTIFIPISSILLKLVISGAYEGETSTLLVPRNSYWKTYILIFLKPEENLQMHQEF